MNSYQRFIFYWVQGMFALGSTVALVVGVAGVVSDGVRSEQVGVAALMTAIGSAGMVLVELIRRVVASIER